MAVHTLVQDEMNTVGENVCEQNGVAITDMISETEEGVDTWAREFEDALQRKFGSILGNDYSVLSGMYPPPQNTNDEIGPPEISEMNESNTLGDIRDAFTGKRMEVA
ncbi:hypothetical protein J7K50_01040 [bacterium]|nr:hypothetical protein [bacterium]